MRLAFWLFTCVFPASYHIPIQVQQRLFFTESLYGIVLILLAIRMHIVRTTMYSSTGVYTRY
jgi:hypothetical protein